MKRRAILLILPALAGFAAVSFAAGPSPFESLPALVESAVRNNPELKSSEARWQMFASKAKQASALEDPMLMLKLQNMVVRQPTSFDKDTQTAKVIGVSQQLPFWGKRAIRQELAGYEAESYRWQIEERKLELTRMVKETYYQLYAVDRALETVAKNLVIVEDLLKIAETRYSVGQGAQADIMRGGVEKSKMLEMQISLQQQRRSLAANMDYLLARTSGSGFSGVPDFDLPAVSLSEEELREAADRNRPQLKSLASLSNKGLTAHRLAEIESYPDFTVSLEYMQRQPAMDDPGDDMYSLALSFNLPVQKERREAMKAESSSESRMADEEITALRNSIRYLIADSLARMEQRKQLVELYRTGLIPQAEQSLESSLIGYRVGKVDFLTLLDSRASLFNYERELSESKAEYMMALARLEATVGAALINE
jgi:outer membrane protein TolC